MSFSICISTSYWSSHAEDRIERCFHCKEIKTKIGGVKSTFYGDNAFTVVIENDKTKNMSARSSASCEMIGKVLKKMYIKKYVALHRYKECIGTSHCRHARVVAKKP